MTADRPALVLVHGFMGGAAQWADQVRALSPQFDVVAVDLPGFGDNAHLPVIDRIGGFADWVLGHLSDRGVGRFHLLGHSMGGMIVQEMVARAPQRVASLVLYGTGPVGLLPGRFETIEQSKRRARADGTVATARRIAATWFLDRDAAPGFAACADLAAGSAPAALPAGLDAMAAWNGEAALADITCPSLVLWGDGDRTYAWAQAAHLWGGISGVRLAVLPGCAHAVHLEKPDLFNAVVADFLGPLRA